ncbi:HD domain-containing protein [bacterium]|nr:HD domain-containing protein [bacterium]
MEKLRELRDPIHGFINRTEREERIIDTVVFQRLRGIKQLALASLVYPGAIHTRFEHSLGVMHIAGLLAEQLLVNHEKVDLIRLAGLLHDIGHGPFSHVSEDILDKYFDQSKIQVKAKEKIHEKLTCDIIEQNKEINELVDRPTKNKIIGLLAGTQGEIIEKNIISGPLDADKQDYLLRDSYFCGVKYGIFDLERLIGTLTSHHDSTEQYLAATEDGIYAIEQFVIAKYHMTTQVYRHKIRLVTDEMIIRALELGIEKDGIVWLNNLYRYDGSEQFINNYLDWDDSRLSVALLFPMNGKQGYATDIFWRLRNRNLFKRVFSKNLNEVEPELSWSLFKLNQKKKKCIEVEVAEYLSSMTGQKVDCNHVIVNSFAFKSVREQSRNNEGSILILKGSGPQKFEDVSTLFRSISESESDKFLQIYAPVEFNDDADKRRKKQKYNQDIEQLIIRCLHPTKPEE